MIYEKLLEPNLLLSRGFKAYGSYAGIRRNPEKLDFCILSSDNIVNSVAVFTSNRFCAAPVTISREKIYPSKKLQALVVNSGYANAGTGQRGLDDAQYVCGLVAKRLGISVDNVAPMSTGVIGNYLPLDKLEKAIAEVELSTDLESGLKFANAIMTTDSCSKQSGYRLLIDDKEVFLCGVAKGSGMIHPNMATMLGFITTDVNIDTQCLDELLKESVKYSFNAISVDGDTSTNDSVFVMASGLAGNKILNKEHPSWDSFCVVFSELCKDLAQQIVRDGEGASKLVVVDVKKARNKDEALRVGRAIVSSNLFKTAIYGSDMNWGRIACAIGYSGVDVWANEIDIYCGDNEEIEIMHSGQGVEFSETIAKSYLEHNTIHFSVYLHQGEEETRTWGCDLTNEYVFINGAKRT